MGICIDHPVIDVSISKLKLGAKLEFNLMKNGISSLTDLDDASEDSLKRIPGVGYASARKILRAYRSFNKSILEKNRPKLSIVTDKITMPQDEPKVPIHPVIDKSGLCSKDKEIINFLVRGYSQQKILEVLKLPKRTLRHRLAMLKIDYQANNTLQLVCNIFDEVYSTSKN